MESVVSEAWPNCSPRASFSYSPRASWAPARRVVGSRSSSSLSRPRSGGPPPAPKSLGTETQRGGVGLVVGEARAEGGGLIPGGGDAGLERRRRRLRVCGGGGIGGRRIARGRRGGDAVIDGREWRWVQRAGRRRGGEKKIRIWAQTFSLWCFVVWSSTKIFLVSLKKVFCERGGWVRVDNNCFQFFHPL